MQQEGGRPTPPIEPSKSGNQASQRGHQGSPQGYQTGGNQYLSARGLVIVFAALTIALVLGYLFVNKLVDMSQEEDCALAHRYNCGAVEVPR